MLLNKLIILLVLNIAANKINANPINQGLVSQVSLLDLVPFLLLNCSFFCSKVGFLRMVPPDD
jgi:hypothetical protein